ncbi:MAG: hypothetical protein A3D92_19365 [Bacteroidetes bacterium RIFCSPHIGHO2_02_FULL_44_7]|nr:MAG: hypothetical protein A3D92_19365 [Bacteroidetes bacterium RIFCSPHIGHO2_02_FULL_44_7]
MKSVTYDHLLNDSNSKVWLVNKVIFGNAVISPTTNYDKHLLIFHNSGHIDYIPYREVTRSQGSKGYYVLDSQERKLILEFNNDQRWEFTMKYMTEDSILLESTPRSDTNISMQLIPLPEL